MADDSRPLHSVNRIPISIVGWDITPKCAPSSTLIVVFRTAPVMRSVATPHHLPRL